MDILNLKKRIQEKKPIFYGNKEIKIVKIYETFKLIDISYISNSQIFTVDIMGLNCSSNNEIKVQSF